MLPIDILDAVHIVDASVGIPGLENDTVGVRQFFVEDLVSALVESGLKSLTVGLREPTIARNGACGRKGWDFGIVWPYPNLVKLMPRENE